MLEHGAAQQQNPQEFLACTKYGMSTSFIIIRCTYLMMDWPSSFGRACVFIWMPSFAHLSLYFMTWSACLLNYVRAFYICKKWEWRPSNVRPKWRDDSSEECDFLYKALIPGKARHQSMDQYGYAADTLLAYHAPVALLCLSSVGIDWLIVTWKDCSHIDGAVAFRACIDGLKVTSEANRPI